RVVFPDGTTVADLPVHRSTEGDGTLPAAQVMVRPQSLRLAGSREGLPVRVLDVTFLGDTSTVQFRTAWGQEIWMRAGADDIAALSPDVTCDVSWNPAESHLFL
ncbi:MAG: TOBE domain-containing protein, partial [Albidovulum sp.]|uniref:TOBE domain-containing protein n=1 Tax=Albidovulum sp. TaxID=1872424 RepID=UPI0013211BD6